MENSKMFEGVLCDTTEEQTLLYESKGYIPKEKSELNMYLMGSAVKAVNHIKRKLDFFLERHLDESFEINRKGKYVKSTPFEEAYENMLESVTSCLRVLEHVHKLTKENEGK